MEVNVRLPATGVGTRGSVPGVWPVCPHRFSPQQKARPSDRTAQTWAGPAETEMYTAPPATDSIVPAGPVGVDKPIRP